MTFCLLADLGLANVQCLKKLEIQFPPTNLILNPVGAILDISAVQNKPEVFLKTENESLILALIDPDAPKRSHPSARYI